MPTLPQPPSEEARRNPCESVWQRRWLDLECHSPAIQQAANEAERWAARVYVGDPRLSLLVLAGETGVGKSKILKACASWARFMAVKMLEMGGWGKVDKPRAPSSMVALWPTVADAVRTKHLDIVNDCIASDILFLDDIGAEDDPFQQATDKLCQILSQRERKHTLITTNITPEHWASRFDARIADRLLRNSVIVDLSAVRSYSHQ